MRERLKADWANPLPPGERRLLLWRRDARAFRRAGRAILGANLEKRSSDGAIVEETRNVLLYNGKIPLNLVQQLFDLHIVEIKHGPSWIVLTADGDGFIPVAFKAKQDIIIRDGKDNVDLQESYAFKANFSS